MTNPYSPCILLPEFCLENLNFFGFFFIFQSMILFARQNWFLFKFKCRQPKLLRYGIYIRYVFGGVKAVEIEQNLYRTAEKLRTNANKRVKDLVKEIF